MENKHANCAHPKHFIRRYGERRRLCIKCGRTFRIRKHKRGRKKVRINENLVCRYFEKTILSSAGSARLKGTIPDSFERKLIRSRDYFRKHREYDECPKGELILIADALVEYINGIWYTGYLTLIRSIKSDEAVIRPIYWEVGKETIPGWTHAFGTLPSSIDSRIRAVVCDGHRGIVYYARWSNWKVQRCHFHLIAAIQGRRSRGREGRHRAEGEYIMKLVYEVLNNTQVDKVPKLLTLIEEIAWQTKSPQLKKILTGFISYSEQFRTYLNYPALHLPTTSNSAESCISLIRDLCRRAHGFRTVDSLMKWTEALLKFRRRIKCRESQPN